ncbi:MAG TPA: hypothetical protein VKZ97_05560 [Flavobacteriaceae bacterium]|nr:hypothetical protein [Flavobacteriaceae bacterium]
MKKLFFIIITLVSVNSYSQFLDKPHRYFFQNTEVSRAEFESYKSSKTYTRKVEDDAAITETLYLHKNIGKLDSLQHQQVTMFLSKIIGSDYKPNKKTMIHLYRKEGAQIKKDSKHKKYWKWIKSNSKEYQSFLIGTKNSRINPEPENHIYYDSYDLLEKLFFKNSDFEINHLLIKPNGDLYIYFGLDDILNVLDLSTE